MTVCGILMSEFEGLPRPKSVMIAGLRHCYLLSPLEAGVHVGETECERLMQRSNNIQHDVTKLVNHCKMAYLSSHFKGGLKMIEVACTL